MGLSSFLIVIQVISALIIIGLVLMQHNKGADMGATFGAGASDSLFGATGSSNFLSKTTAIITTVFFSVTLGLAYLSNHRTTSLGKSVMDNTAAIALPTQAPPEGSSASVPSGLPSAPPPPPKTLSADTTVSPTKVPTSSPPVGGGKSNHEANNTVTNTISLATPPQAQRSNHR